MRSAVPAWLALALLLHGPARAQDAASGGAAATTTTGGGSGAGASSAAALAIAAASRDLYLEALQAISEGRATEGSAVLAQMIEQGAHHAGEWLDLALIHCALGHAAEAERTFATIEARFAPPPGIREIIAQQRLQGCVGNGPRRQWSLKATRGYDQNVNQGASSPFFTPGSGQQLQLLPEYLPHADAYSVLTGDYAQDLGGSGGAGFAQVQARRNNHLSGYDTTSLFGGVEQPWNIGRWRLRGGALAGALTLGGRLYQEQAQLQLRAIPPLALPRGFELQLVAGLSHVSYQTLSAFDSNISELRGILDYRAGARQLQLGLARLNDRATGTRPGGDRHGWSFALSGRSRLFGKLEGEIDWIGSTWRGSTAYAPGLIEDIRSQQTHTVRAALLYPLNDRSTLQLEWRRVRNRENISIFQYNSGQLQLSWHWRGGAAND